MYQQPWVEPSADLTSLEVAPGGVGGVKLNMKPPRKGYSA